jgi:hypothetical protein
MRIPKIPNDRTTTPMIVATNPTFLFSNSCDISIESLSYRQNFKDQYRQTAIGPNPKTARRQNAAADTGPHTPAMLRGQCSLGEPIAAGTFQYCEFARRISRPFFAIRHGPDSCPDSSMF